MSRRQRILKSSIFIACEGHTEEKYFSAIGEDINENDSYSVKVKVLEIEDGVPQDPLGLVREALKIKNEEGHDEAWAVFDKDRELNQQIRINAFSFAASHGIKIAFSSIAFEHWVLLHFEKNNNTFARCDCESRGDVVCNCAGAICVCGYLKTHYFPDYKKGSYKLYSGIKSKNLNALENSAWLRFQNRALLSQLLEIQPPYDLNPHTDVDLLVLKLLDLPQILFSQVGISKSLNGLEITVISRNGTVLQLSIRNNTRVGFIVNNACDFKIRDHQNNIYSHHIPVPVQIAPTATAVVDINFNGIPNNNIEFLVKDANSILIVPV